VRSSRTRCTACPARDECCCVGRGDASATDIRSYRGPALRGGASPVKERDESKWIETLAWEVIAPPNRPSFLTSPHDPPIRLCPFALQRSVPRTRRPLPGFQESPGES
jgi:hypothetical protein